MTMRSGWFDAELIGEEPNQEPDIVYQLPDAFPPVIRRIMSDGGDGLDVGPTTPTSLAARFVGFAVIDGFWMEILDEEIEPLAEADPADTRFDLAVIRLDRAERTIKPYVITGTPGAGTPPDPVDDGTITDLPVRVIEVEDGAFDVDTDDFGEMLAPNLGLASPIGDSVPRVPLLTATAAGDATLDFTSLIDGTYDIYEFELLNLEASTSTYINARLSSNGGSTWDSTSGDYEVANVYISSASETTPSGNAGATEAFRLSQSSVGHNLFSGIVRLYHPSLAFPIPLSVDTINRVTSPTVRSSSFRGGGHRLANGPYNAVRFYPNTGNFTSGTINMYGRKF